MRRSEKIDRKDIDDIIALTPMQKGMLFHYLKNPKSDEYFEQLCLGIYANVQFNFFQKAWEFVVETNEMLRTLYRWEKLEKPIQIILKQHSLRINLNDISNEVDENKEKLLQKIKTEDRKKNFNLSSVPFRVTLCKTTEDKYQMIISNHHILYDGWSTGIILKEFFKAYNDLLVGKQLIHPRKNRFREFVKWIENQDRSKEEIYWKEYLKGFNGKSSFSLDSGKEKADRRFGQYTYKFSKKLTKKVLNFAKEKKLTLAALLYSSWGILLQRYINSEDVVFGTAISGRNVEISGIDNIVGLFVNTLPLRINTSNDINVLQLLKNVTMSMHEREKYEATSLVDIKKYCGINRKGNIFDSLLVIENYPLDSFITNQKNVLTVNDYSIFERTNFDLTISVTTLKDIDITYYFNKAVFSDEIILKISQHFEMIVKNITNYPEKKVDEIDMLTNFEEEQILNGFNNTGTNFPKNKTIKVLFEDQAEKTPEGIAVIYEDTQLTYKELNERANQVARVLREKGIGPDNIVGIIIEKSLDMVIGIIGILKAGGAYLPIDPNCPKDRIEFMLIESDVSLLLTTKKVAKQTGLNKESVYIDDEDIYKNDKTNLICLTKPNNLAYVIYTSGTTDRPKGVMIEHKNVVRLMFNDNFLFDFNSSDVWTMFHSYCFDFSVWEMYGALLYGGKLILIPELVSKDPLSFLEILKEEGVTVLNQTPSAFYNLINEELKYSEANLNMKYVILGGDALKPIKLKMWKDKYPKTKIINMYGITETTVHATFKEISYKEIKSNISNIGKPIPTLRAYIMNHKFKILPIGVPGELYIGGEGIARGYLNRPNLTKEKFIENPYKNGERIYKSGDLVRLLSNGEMEYLGRIDNQVKIRGYRVELGEIENSLLKHKKIKEAVVIEREDEEGNKYLCAYVVSDKEFTVTEIRKFLSKRLSDYMIPSYFIYIEKIPITTNGKIDREALLKLDIDTNTSVEYEAPRNDIEEILLKIWQEVLSINRDIGINDNFFEIGGDSIKAIQISARLQKYNLKIEVKNIFKYPTIKQLSFYVKDIMIKTEQSLITGYVNLTPIQKCFFQKNITDMHHWNQSVMLYREEGFKEEIIKKAFREIEKHHDALRIVYKKRGKKVKQINRGLERDLIDIEVYDLGVEYEKSIEERANRIQGSIDLYKGSLVKLALFKTERGDYLLIVIHHLIIDGVSWRILFEDFTTVYEQIENGHAINLPLKTTSFKEWAQRLSEYSKNKELLKTTRYWSDIESIDILPLPMDDKAIDNKLKDSNNIFIQLSKEETENLLGEVNKAYNTEINDILLSAIGVTIKEWTGHNKVLINVEGHGREEIIENVDITRTIGWFTSQYPVVIDMNKSDELAYVIKNTKETLRRIPNKGIGYGILKYMTPKEYKEEINFKLVPEINFNYLGQIDADINNNLFEMSNISAGNAMSINSERCYTLDIGGVISKGVLNIRVNYNYHQYKKETIFQLVNMYKKNLQRIINHCTNKEDTEKTLSDFTSYDLDELEVDKIFDSIKDITIE
ncbi:non-ribosomal peptide synthetase [Abyssisolibacter fermentans]|uniref:non-ribosomal peptide synthetase n=1 Tax=Abyssisolibacter fermentans TaxID=1766203 RepID=UPI0008332A3B|nr:non-ribosomal peptide synthetase [Abyssisolibacter fermentans]